MITRLIFSLFRPTVSVSLSLIGSYSHVAAVISFGMSMSTGPGLPDDAMIKASLIVSANSSTERTMKLCLVIGIVTPVISIS